MKEYWKIRVSFPVVNVPEYLHTWWFKSEWYIKKDKEELFKISPHLSYVNELLLDEKTIWKIWNYKWVFHLSNIVEVYTPDIGSNPWESLIWETELMNTIMFETFFEKEKIIENELIEFCEKILDNHPYETPIIEIIDNNWIRIFGV